MKNINIIKWLFCKDIKENDERRQKEIDNYHASGSPINLEKGIKLLMKNIADLNYSTTKYSRILIILTIVIVAFTIVSILIN